MVMNKVGQWMNRGGAAVSSKKVPMSKAAQEADNAISARDDAEIAMLTASLVIADGTAKTQRLASGNTLCLQPDGSYVVRNQQNLIIKTCDVLGSKRDYHLDLPSATLWVKRFGVWSCPDEAAMDQNTGTFSFKNGTVRIEERLDSVHTQVNTETGDEIHTNHKEKWELVVLANGETWQRETNEIKETFAMWKNGKVTFHSETYFAGLKTEAMTPTGRQALICVSRLERSLEDGILAREKFTFKNTINNRKDVALTLHFGTNVVLVKNVAAIITVFADGRPFETTYTLSAPTNLRIDSGKLKGNIEGVVSVVSKTGVTSTETMLRTQNGNEFIL